MQPNIRSGITFGIIGGLLAFIFGGWSVGVIGILMGCGLGLSIGGRLRRGRSFFETAMQALPAAAISGALLLILSLAQNYIIAPAIGDLPSDSSVVIPANLMGVLGGIIFAMIVTGLHGLSEKQENIGKLIVLAVIVVSFPFVDNFTGLRWVARSYLH